MLRSYNKLQKNKNRVFVKTNSPEHLCDMLGIRPTRSRLILLYEIMSRKTPFNSEDIVVATSGGSAGRATVFRNILLFKEIGILREVDIRQDSIFYEYNVDNHHHHIVCTECGHIEDFDVCDADLLIKDAIKQSKYFQLITDHSFEMFGICKVCQNRIGV